MPGELDETRPHSITEVAGRVMLEPISPGLYNLTYACLLVPRFSNHGFGDPLAQVGVIGVALPIVAWTGRRETFWISLPVALVLLIGGVVTVILIRKRRPLQAVTAVALLMVALTISGSLCILPYVNQFKSRRSFSLEINRIVPPAAPLYIYADTMNDFNFYTEREVITVLSSPGEVAHVHRQTGDRYLLIKDRDLKSLSIPELGEVVARDSLGSTTWNLISLKSPTALEKPPDHGHTRDSVPAL